MAFTIQPADLQSAETIALLEAHRRWMKAFTPPEYVWALPVDALRAPDISVWIVRDDDSNRLAGCGALKRLDDRHGEIKSMRTVENYLRRGVAKSLLEFLIDEARRREFARLSLETGAHDAFKPARKLYETMGFAYCGAFADYPQNPHSVFMTQALCDEDDAIR